MKDLATRALPWHTRAAHDVRVPGRTTQREQLDPLDRPSLREQGSLFAGVPWSQQAASEFEPETEHDAAEHDAAEHDAAEHDAGPARDAGDTEPAAEADALDAEANEGTDPTCLDADAAPDPDMIGGDGKRVRDTDAEAEDTELPHRAQLERAFGVELAGVTARRGVDLSALGANAAAQGDHVAFAEQSPSPGLVAHEVTHVLQQRRAGRSALAASRTIAPADSAAEHEAERNQRRIDDGATRLAPVAAAPAGGIHLSRKSPYAKQDAYNKKAVKANHKRRGKRDLDRAGVRVGEHSDVWKLDGKKADRYRIVNGNTAAKVDTISDNVDIAINPARVRRLNIPGVGLRDCCFVWARGFGAAWLPINKLAGNHDAKIKAAIQRTTRAWTPAVKRGPTSVHHFATGGMSRQANDEWIRPNSGTKADRIQDYLEKTVPTGNGGTRSYFNVMLNLPQSDAAPVAIDFAQPGDLFFVVRGMEREISLWKKGQRKTPTGGKQKWVFGYLAKNGQPDLVRRGWVPKRVLRPGRS